MRQRVQVAVAVTVDSDIARATHRAWQHQQRQMKEAISFGLIKTTTTTSATTSTTTHNTANNNIKSLEATAVGSPAVLAAKRAS